MKYFNNDKTSYFIDKLKRSDRCLTFSFSIADDKTITVDSGHDIKQVKFSTSTPDYMLFEMKPYASGETAPTWITDGSTKYMVFGNTHWKYSPANSWNSVYYSNNAATVNSTGAYTANSTYPLFYFNVSKRSSYYQDSGNSFSNFYPSSGYFFKAYFYGRVVLL